MKRDGRRRLTSCPFAVVTFALTFFGTLSAPAQQAGDMVEVTWAGQSTKAKIESCRTEGCNLYLYDASSGRWSEGTAFFPRHEIRGIKKSAPQLSREEETERSKQKGVSTSGRATATPAPTRPDCSFDPPTGKVSRGSAASEQLFRRVIYDWFALDVKEGGTTNPLRVGVTFLEFQLGKTFVNRVFVDAGTGAHRLQDGAPTDATIYPVKAKYVHCRAYRDAIQREVVQEDFACFKDKFGDWTCPANSVRQILETAYIPLQK